MEETRISHMYLNLFKRWCGGLFTGRSLRSPVTWIVLALLLLVAGGIALHERGRGDLSAMEAHLGRAPLPPAAGLTPGGQPPILLTRRQSTNASSPEFLSATLLPGLGLNLFQITAFVPGRGVVSLLASPALDAATDDALNQGASIELPWAGPVSGPTLPGGLSLRAEWQGRDLTLPANGSLGNQPVALGGLLGHFSAAAEPPTPLPDGSQLRATLAAGDLGGQWPSSTSITADFELTAHTLDLTLTAQNTGSAAEPMGLGWHPRFALPADRSTATLTLPAASRAELQKGLPTGRVLPPAEPSFRSPPGGSPLGALGLDDLLVHLSASRSAELRLPALGYGVRLTPLSPNLQAMRVQAPANASFLVLAPQTNLDDPFSHAWAEGSGIAVLQPGQSLETRLRLELFAVPTTASKEAP